MSADEQPSDCGNVPNPGCGAVCSCGVFPAGVGGYISETTQQRRWRAPDVIRNFRWDREGVHFPVGVIIAALTYAGQFHAAWMVLTFFLAYEISEGWRIRDGAFRDIGAAFIAFLVAYGVALALWGLKLLPPPAPACVIVPM